MEYLTLYNGVKMPKLGFGCAAIHSYGDNSAAVTETISEAISAGYRHLDTAAVYKTEKNVGDAVRASGIARRDFFIVTKLHTDDMDYEAALRAAEKSLKNLGADYIDLYLVHWPLRDKYLEAWRALERLYKEGVVKAIGGSNFALRHFEGIEKAGLMKPMSNQVELNPYMQQNELRDFCRKEGVAVTAWSPLGTGSWSPAKAEEKPINSEVIKRLAASYGKTPAQIILRWMMDIGISAVPKSEKPARIAENFAVFDFTLKQQDIDAIARENKNLSLASSFNGGPKELYGLV